uniref:Uncharacterized protein n=1 Tax=Arundo donax TaxID=35708 RepID=A0A0A9GF83_ARUDO
MYPSLFQLFLFLSSKTCVWHKKIHLLPCISNLLPCISPIVPVVFWRQCPPHVGVILKEGTFLGADAANWDEVQRVTRSYINE